MQELLATADQGHLDVDGCAVAWARWPGAHPPIVLVHGAGAHLGWWEAVVGPLTEASNRPTVVALELSGHGTSGHRSAYGPEVWSREVNQVIRDIAGGPSLLVGHSLGGRVAICAAAAEPTLVPRLVLVDAPVRRPGTPRPNPFSTTRSLPRRSHPTLAQAVQSFRLRPREPVADAALLHRIAAAAFAQQSDAGWTLKADLSVFGRIPDELIADALASYSGPITLIYGTHSAVVDDNGRDHLQEAHHGPTELVAVAGHHHLTIDQGAEIAALLAERHRLLPAQPSP